MRGRSDGHIPEFRSKPVWFSCQWRDTYNCLPWGWGHQFYEGIVSLRGEPSRLCEGQCPKGRKALKEEWGPETTGLLLRGPGPALPTGSRRDAGEEEAAQVQGPAAGAARSPHWSPECAAGGAAGRAAGTAQRGHLCREQAWRGPLAVSPSEAQGCGRAERRPAADSGREKHLRTIHTRQRHIKLV